MRRLFFDGFLEWLPEEPGFNRFVYRDKNPLGGTTKTRIIYAPNDAMRELHQRIISWVRYLEIPGLEFATGAIPKSSPLRNVKVHRNNRFFYLVDLKNAYPSVDGWKLACILCKLDPNISGKEEETFHFLSKYCLLPTNTDNQLQLFSNRSQKSGGLLTGAPASPDLFNIYIAQAIVKAGLEELIEKYGLTLSYYLDDFCFSASQWKGRIGTRKRRKILDVIRNAGFTINDEKTGAHDLRREGAVKITGLILHRNKTITIPKSYMRTLEGLLHRATFKRDVPHAVVEGMMGVLRGILPTTDISRLNRAQQRVFEKYQQYLRLTA